MKASGQSRTVDVEICRTFWKWDQFISLSSTVSFNQCSILIFHSSTNITLF